MDGETLDIQGLRRNPYFIGINSAINATKRINKCVERVAILILLELTLQLKIARPPVPVEPSRNPYFIGINSAIEVLYLTRIWAYRSQSLFYWN